MSKISKIERISEESLRSEYTIKYALYSTLKYEEIIKYLKENYLNVEIRDKLLKQLEKRYVKQNCEELISFLIEKYENANGKIKRIIGKIFTVLDEKLNTFQREKIYKLSIKSNMPSIRKKGYEQAYSLYNRNNIKKDLIDNWEKYHDIEVIYIFIAKDDYDYIYNNFKELWNNTEINIKLKHDIINKLGKYNKDILPKIKELDLVSFMSASYHANNKNFLSNIKEIFYSVKSIGELCYCIWILGQMGLYNTIFDLIPDIKKIEKQLPKTFQELQYEMLYGEINKY